MDGRKAITRPVMARGAHGACPEEAWTPYIAQTRDRARAASNRLVSSLMDHHALLVGKVYRQAAVVERQHDFDRDLTAATRGRFVETLAGWRVAVAPARACAEAAVDRANQLIHCYWGAFLRAYRESNPSAVPPDEWRPGVAVIDPYWAKPDPFLLLRFRADDDAEDEATRRAGRTLGRALEIISDCDCSQCNRPDPEDEGELPDHEGDYG